MKKLVVIIFAIIATADLSAQKSYVRPVPVMVTHSPRIVYIRPYYAYRPYFGYGYGYNPWFYGGLGYPYNNSYYYNHPSKLDRQVMDIEQDYNDRIQSVRLDNSLSGHERRQKIRELRHERKSAVYDAKRNYYKQPYSNNNNSQPDNNQ